jgi:hypothetical protein
MSFPLLATFIGFQVTNNSLSSAAFLPELRVGKICRETITTLLQTQIQEVLYVDPSIIKERDGTEKRKVVIVWLRSG